MNPSSFYWSSPEWIKAIIRKTFKARDSWTIKVKRNSYGEWTFNKFPIMNEPFVNQTNRAIDIHFEDIKGRVAVEGDTITINATINKPNTYTSVMEKMGEVSDWGMYRDSGTQVICDICPVGIIMWGEHPDKFYVTYS